MNVVISRGATFICYVILNMGKMLKKIHDFLVDVEKVKSELFWITKLWYAVLVVLSSIYVFCNFTLIVNKCFIGQFDGNCLVFIVWILLLMVPLFNRIEGCGFKFIRDNEVRAQNVRIWNLSDEVSKHGSAPELENLKKQFESTKHYCPVKIPDDYYKV